MADEPIYFIPAHQHRIETEVARSRFITTIARAATVEEARSLLAQIRSEMPDASHHVYAFRIGHGPSVIEGMSDDGEPSGTSGPPTLAVLRGSGLGDIVLVTTRYFGGTKLGTGGLVRAYSEAAHLALNSLKTEAKIEKRLLGIELPYSLYEQCKLLIQQHEGVIEDEDFGGEVTLMVRFPVFQIGSFTADLSDLSSGRVTPIPIDEPD
jgi:uncharacterized YigZ family protein